MKLECGNFRSLGCVVLIYGGFAALVSLRILGKSVDLGGSKPHHLCQLCAKDVKTSANRAKKPTKTFSLKCFYYLLARCACL